MPTSGLILKMSHHDTRRTSRVSVVLLTTIKVEKFTHKIKFEYLTSMKT